MGWVSGIVIRGGYLQDAIIGISDNIVTENLGYVYSWNNVNDSAAQQVESDDYIFYNSDFEKMINVSSYFSLSHANFADECIADIAIIDDDKNLTGFFSLYFTRSGLIVTVNGKVKNASGVVLGSFHSSGAINIDSRTEPICYLCFAKTTYNNRTFYGLYFNMSQKWTWSGTGYAKKVFAGAFICDDTIYDTWGIGGHIDSEVKEESPEFGPEAEPGGYVGSQQGTHNKSSDHSGIPTKPQYGFSSAGFLSHYLITSQGLSMLGEALFPEPAGVSVDVAAAVDKLIANMWNSKIIDYVIDCRIIPARPHNDGMHDITCGGKRLVNPGTSAIYRAALIDEDFVDVDCGELTTPLTEGNFLDFYQMSCKLFLPFYGYVDIAPEYWHGATIGVYYRFNMMDGSFMVWVTSKAFNSDMQAGDVIAQYSGNACIHLPINSVSYSNIIGGMITTGAAIVGTAAGAGAAVGAAGSAAKALKISNSYDASILGQAASGAANIINSRPQLNANNSYNGSGALMSKRKPYLLIEFNNPQFSKNYVAEQGLPLVVTRQIGDMSGMTVCDNAIINFACTEVEQQEILAALREGVIV